MTLASSKKAAQQLQRKKSGKKVLKKFDRNQADALTVYVVPGVVTTLECWKRFTQVRLRGRRSKYWFQTPKKKDPNVIYSKTEITKT